MAGSGDSRVQRPCGQRHRRDSQKGSDIRKRFWKFNGVQAVPARAAQGGAEQEGPQKSRRSDQLSSRTGGMGARKDQKPHRTAPPQCLFGTAKDQPTESTRRMMIGRS